MCTVPFWRLDVEGEHDLIEEVVRLKGYDKIPSRLPLRRSPQVPSTPISVLTAKAKNSLVPQGFFEGCSSSFVSRKMIEVLDPQLLDASVAVENPLSEEQEYLRPNLAFHLVDSVRKNKHQGVGSLKLFETGRCFEKRGDEFHEFSSLGLVVVSDKHAKHWKIPAQTVDFFEIKSWCELLAETWALEVSFKPGTTPYLHPKASANVMRGNETIGRIGLVHPSLAKTMDISPETAIAEFTLEKIPVATPAFRFQEPPKYPPVKRDLALILKKEILWTQIEEVAKTSAGRLLEKIAPFDVFSGGTLAPEEKSVAFSLSLRNPDKTLTDHDADWIIQRMLQDFKEKIGARLRGEFKE